MPPALALTGALLSVAAVALACIADRAVPIAITPNKTRPPARRCTRPGTRSRASTCTTSSSARGGGRGGRNSSSMPAPPPLASWISVRTCAPRCGSSRHAHVRVERRLRREVAPRVLIIGAAGGEEVLDALHFGAAAITAVEINPIITDIVTHRMRDFWGGLFAQPEVRLVTDEGRSFVRRSREQYDAILSVHTISNAAIASGALALAENYVLTREAFVDYLDHLTPDGVLYVVRPEAQLARLVATGRESLAARGVVDPAGHFYLYHHPASAPRGQWVAPNRRRSAGFLMKSPFTPEEVRLMQTHLGLVAARWNCCTRRSNRTRAASITRCSPRPIRARCMPRRRRSSPRPPMIARSLTSTRAGRVSRGQPWDVFTQGRLGRLALEDRPVAEVTVLVLLVQAILLAAGLIGCRWSAMPAQGCTAAARALPALLRQSRHGLHPDRDGVDATLHACAGAARVHRGRRARRRSSARARCRARRALAVPAAAALRWILPLLVVTVVGTACLTPVICAAALALPLGWRILVALPARAARRPARAPFPLGCAWSPRKPPPWCRGPGVSMASSPSSGRRWQCCWAWRLGSRRC